jgi:hypothetical protein
MAINQDYPILDGIAPSWADIQVSSSIYDGPLVEMKDIKAINTSRSVEVGKQRGASGGRTKRRTVGQSDEEASWTLYRTGYDDLIRALASVAPARGNERLISLVHFDIQYQYSPPGSVKIFERKILGCRVIGDTMNDTEGSDPQEVEVPLSVIKIVDVIDGVEIVLI